MKTGFRHFTYRVVAVGCATTGLAVGTGRGAKALSEPALAVPLCGRGKRGWQPTLQSRGYGLESKVGDIAGLEICAMTAAPLLLRRGRVGFDFLREPFPAVLPPRLVAGERLAKASQRAGGFAGAIATGLTDKNLAAKSFHRLPAMNWFRHRGGGKFTIFQGRGGTTKAAPA